MTNSPATNYLFDHYTVDGVSQSDNIFILTKDATVSGLFKWNGIGPEPTIYTVTFNTNGGTPEPQNQFVASGDKIIEPIDVTKTGYELSGWYNEPEFFIKWNFATDTVDANITLYAKWILSGGGGNDDSVVWLWSNQKHYTVADGVASDISYEINPTWINYTDARYYEEQYGYTIPYITYTVNDTYTSSIIGSIQFSVTYSRNENTAQNITRQITNYTTTIDYVNPDIDDSVTTTSSDITSTYITVYDEETGLILSTTSTSTGTQNGSPYSYNSEINYTLELLNTVDGVKTYKVYDTTTGGTGVYNVYKVKNGVTLEMSYYTAGDVLSYTMFYTFHENAAIATKIPTFTLYRLVYESIPESNNYQTCEVLSDSETELKIRVETYSTADVLTAQYETTYVKYVMI